MADVTRMGTSELVPVSQTELVSVEISARLRFVPGSTLGDDSFSIVTGPSAMKAFRTDANRKIPYESLTAGSIGEALSMYRAIRTSDQSDQAVAENSLNLLGYEFLRQNKVKEAIAIFRLNVEFYPNSSNVYDSLGEGLAANGEKEEAIRNYKKSLELNPNNKGAVEALKKLQD
jgi:tetratricopeptide (TPR) repeat protein